MSCHIDGEEVTLLYKIADGVCPRSFGMNAAAQAGMDSQVRLSDATHVI